MISFDAPIVQCEILPFSIPVRMAFATAQETLQHADNVLVRLTDANGLTGLGEAAPFAAYTGDSSAAVQNHIPTMYESIRGLSCAEAMRYVERERTAFMNLTISGFVALETALYDLCAKQRGVPLYELFGGLKREVVDVDITMPILQKQDVAKFLQLFGRHQFLIFKVKVGGNLSHDLDCVVELMRLVGAGKQFFLDGNQGYQLDGAVKLVGALHAAGLKPLFFEQPLAKDDWDGSRKLSAVLPIPVCLDETIQTARDIVRMVDTRAATMANLKIMKSGVGETLRIIAAAKQSGVKLMIGGMLETEVAMNASLHIAAAAGDAIQHFDLDTPFFLTERVTRNSPWHNDVARLEVSHRAGSGLELAL